MILDFRLILQSYCKKHPPFFNLILIGRKLNPKKSNCTGIPCDFSPPSCNTQFLSFVDAILIHIVRIDPLPLPASDLPPIGYGNE